MIAKKEISRQRELDVWEMRQRSYTQEEIAKRVGVSQPAVAKILKKLNNRYLERCVDSIERVKGEQIVQLEHIACEAMIAWEQSKHSGVDPRCLTAAMKAKEDIRKIIGADAPARNVIEKHNITLDAPLEQIRQRIADTVNSD